MNKGNLAIGPYFGFLLGCLLVIFFSCEDARAPRFESIENLVLGDDLRFRLDGQIYSGPVRELSEKRGKRYHIYSNCDNGYLSGLQEKFLFQEGKEVRVGMESFEKGIRVGPFKNWFLTGELSSEGVFVNGKKAGQVSAYYKNGAIRKLSTYQNGKREGAENEYYRTGEWKAKYFYSAGKQTGRQEQYYTSQHLKELAFYKKGKRDSITKKYFVSGDLKSAANFKNGKLEGPFRDWHGTRKKFRVLNYQKGKLHGAQIYYDTKGQLHRKIEFVNGIKQGLDITYYPNGAIKFHEVYQKGVPVQTSEFFDDQGRIICKQKFKENGDRSLLREWSVYEGNLMLDCEQLFLAE